MPRRIGVLCALGIALLALPGCPAFNPIVGYVAAETYTLINTDKLIVDHVASYKDDMDCSSVKAVEGEPYCKAPPPPATERVYCYRTLGRVNCFDRPDPAYVRLGTPIMPLPGGERTLKRPAGVR